MKSPATHAVAAVARLEGGHRLTGAWAGVDAANVFLADLETRAFSPATVRAYAFDLVNFARFLDQRGIVDVADVVPTDIFDWIDWQSVRRPHRDKVVAITGRRGSAPASVNRRAARSGRSSNIRCWRGREGTTRCRLLVGAKGCDPRHVVCSVTLDRAGPARAGAWFASIGACPSRSSQLTCRRSWLIWVRIETGRSYC